MTCKSVPIVPQGFVTPEDGTLWLAVTEDSATIVDFVPDRPRRKGMKMLLAVLLALVILALAIGLGVTVHWLFFLILLALIVAVFMARSA